MPAPGHTTPLRSDAFNNLQLNAGIFIKNFTYSSTANASALKTAITAAITAGTNILGVTRGGGSFTVTREMRQPDVDGVRYGFKGDTFVDSVDAQLSTTLLEITPGTFLTALAGSSMTPTTIGAKNTIKLATAINTSTDYLTNLCWIGDLADGRYVLICLKNALNQADLTLTFTDKGEGTIPVEFHAKQAGVNDYDEAPFEIVFFGSGS